MNKLIKNNVNKFKFGLIGFSILYIITIVLSLIEPLLFGKILDNIIDSSGVINVVLKKQILTLCLVVFISFIITFIYRRIIFTTGRKIKQGILCDLLHNFENRSITFFETIDKGTFVSYITNDIDNLWSIISHGAIEITRVFFFTTVGYIISIKYVNFLLSSSVFALFPFFLYLIIKLNYISQKFLTKKKDLEANLSKIINDGFVGFSVIKSYVNESEVINKFNGINNSIKTKECEYSKTIAKIDFISTIFKGLSFSIACIYGIDLVKQDVITIGSFIAFNSIIQKVLSGYVYTGNLVKKANEIKIINNRLDLLYEININSTAKQNMPNKPNIIIKNLSFKYKNQKDNILENINLDIPYGSFIGITGKAGTGKTTLINILTKFYEIDNQTIFFDNVDINNINSNDFYDHISYVMQDDYIYDNSIKYNIELGKKYNYIDINNSVKKASFSQVVKSLPEKYNTYIGECGIKISGGQKQRLILSRNLLKKPEILIIDNGLTGLDVETRKKIINKITKNNKITLILVSDIIDDFENADKVYTLENKSLKQMKKNKEKENYD